LREEKRLHECSKRKRKKKSGRLMRGENGAIVENSFEKIQEQEQDNNEEE